MAEVVELEALDLAALLCSRVCHDIISPVGAIINGLEVLDEDNGEEMKTFAFDLIRRSFRNWFRPNYPYVYATFRCVS